MAIFKTRRAQFQDFVKDFYRETDLCLTRAHRALLNRLVRDVAICAAAEERQRTMQILDQGPTNAAGIICGLSVAEVLGYKQPRPRREE